jgi:hypothetical protein
MRSRLDFCNVVLSENQLDRLQSVFKALARMIFSARHVTPLPQQLYWLPVYERIAYVLFVPFPWRHNTDLLGLRPSVGVRRRVTATASFRYDSHASVP